MHAHRKEREREEKTPTPEVSNRGLAADNNFDPVGSPDAIAVSALRRRNVSAKLNPCVERRATSDDIADSSLTFHDLSAGANLEVRAPRDSRKSIKYPKLIASYPKIPPNPNKNHPRDVRRSPRRTDVAFSKPPCSQPSIFLKCKVKKQIPSEEKAEAASDDDDDDDDHQSDDLRTSGAVSQTTDLDIQLSNLKLESLIASGSSAAKLAKKVRDVQTLEQYCNFDEKKVMRVAPHIRRKDVICDTVDAWSHDNDMSDTSGSPEYKPLVFGGTYPIDLPLRFTNDRQTAEEGREEGVSPVKKSVSLTYDIDVPIKCE